MRAGRAKAVKLYLHFQGQPVHTHVLPDVTADVTIGDICKGFAKVLTAKGVDVQSDGLQASTAKGRILAKSSTVHRSVGSDADVYISLAPVEGPPAPACGSDNGPKELHAAALSDDGQQSPAEQVPGAATTAQEARVSPLIAPLLSQAAEKEAAQHLRAAAFIYQQARPLLQLL